MPVFTRSLRFVILILAAMLLQAPIAAAQSVGGVLTDFGLLGNWSVDCNRPPSRDNSWSIWVLYADGRVVRRLDWGDGDSRNDYVVTSARRVAPDRLQYNMGGYDIVMEKRDGKIHTVSSKDSTGKVLIANGIIVDSGQPAVWQSRCG